MQPLVSVIVPVYNVEKYLVRCLDSLRRQNMKEIEILLIDDASPDTCGEICDNYAAKDARFRVFHNKTNQGLSVARNIGIEHAISDYLMFVDSDDWVHEDFCKDAYECAVHYHVDLVMFRFQHVKKTFISLIENYISRNSLISSRYITQIEAIDLLQTFVGGYTWNKLYRKELFNGVTFPPGYYFEDIGTIYKTICKTPNIYYLDKSLYFYRYRTESISTLKGKKILHDLQEMHIQQYQDLKKWKYPPEKLDFLFKNLALSYCIKKKRESSDPNYGFYANELRLSKKIPESFTWERKVLFFMLNYCPWLFEVTCFLWNKKLC